MHTGLLTTDADTPLRVVARLMAQQHVHAVAVADPDLATRPYTFVSSVDVARAAAEQADLTAGEAAAAAQRDVVFVAADERLCDAAAKLVDRGVSHAVVLDPDTAHPLGILSTLDVAAAYGG